MGKRQEQAFLQGRYTNNQQAHKKMLDIITHQENSNQNQNEIPTKMARIKKLR